LLGADFKATRCDKPPFFFTASSAQEMHGMMDFCPFTSDFKLWRGCNGLGLAVKTSRYAFWCFCLKLGLQEFATMVSFGRDFCGCKGLLEGPRFVAFSPYFNLSQQRVKLGYKVVHHFIPSIVVSERHAY